MVSPSDSLLGGSPEVLELGSSVAADVLEPDIALEVAAVDDDGSLVVEPTSSPEPPPGSVKQPHHSKASPSLRTIDWIIPEVAPPHDQPQLIDQT
jgi:hypothetical protein